MNKKPQQPPDEGNGDIGCDLERLDNLLRRGLNEISDIEIDEITKGMSDEEMESYATTGIVRSEYSQTKKIAGIVFEEQIQFIVENDLDDADDIPVESIAPLRTVPSETKIAEYTITETSHGEPDDILRLYDQEYQNRSGVTVRTDGSRFLFYASRPGKVVLFRNRLFLMAADKDASCNVRIAKDAMEAFIDCTPALGDGRKLKFSAVLDLLEKNNVIRGIDKAAIEKAVGMVNTKGLSVRKIVAARGKPPQNGKNSEITVHFPTEVPDIGFTILPDGRIDYKKQAPIKMVSSGDLLASVSEPEPGTDGYTVKGEILPAEQGAADDILEGDNVRRGETGDRFYAECSGVVSFHENVLNVYPHYQVEGDVDMHSGNINFNGSVTILGSVKSGFEVKANGDIFIAGSTEGATIEAGRDVRINGAAVGGNNTILRSGRNFFAGHVQNAQIEAQGDITIVRSVMHSFIYSTGKLELHDKNGSIVGGMVNILRGIEAMSIGSHIGTQTEIVVGSDYLVKRRKAELKEVMRFHEANLAKIDTVLRPLMSIVKKGIPLGTEKKRRLGSIIDKRFNILKQLRVVRRHHEELLEIDPLSINAEITVRNTLFQDVTIRIGNCAYRTTDDLKAVVCRMNADRKSIELVPFSSVKKPREASRP
ncbi:MAG: DUF342 domain-containing protein [Chitinispirillaceae bacterium]|nr:DUF342 domain-containing protein [Chitinispirillaceae bacterium]